MTEPTAPHVHASSVENAATTTTNDEEALHTLAEILGADIDEWDEVAGPIHWPSLSGEEVGAEWDSLRRWVTRFVIRFPHLGRIPECWWMHDDLVEALSALRDHERASYASTAPPTAAVEWHRALRDMADCWERWIKRFACSVDGRGHQPISPDDTEPQGWDDWIAADAQRRQSYALAHAVTD